MLTLITGTPGAGKSLYSVWELARKVPGSTIESGNEAVPRRLLSNVKDLLVEHEQIGAEQLNTWHEWAKPGDVILYDEVQEVWRPRAMGTNVPPCIAALETHRHKGVDIILVTQHPMLVDPNIRRLVNQHLHLRRLAKTVAMVYEWDHCANPGQVKSALQSKVWFHPKQAYKLYKSAQLHTKPVTRVPRLLYVALLALAGLGVIAPMAYGRIASRFEAPQATTPAAATGNPTKAAQEAASGLVPPPDPAQPGNPVQAAALLGCIASKTSCRCWESSGQMATVTAAQCMEEVSRVGNLVTPNGPASALATPVPPAARSTEVPPEAAAPARPVML